MRAYWCGIPLTNGTIAPYFTLADGLELCSCMSRLTYDPARDAFREVRPGRRPRWYHAAAVSIDGQVMPLYAIGAGDWHWTLALATRNESRRA